MNYELWIMNWKKKRKERKREKRRDKEEHAHEWNEWNEEDRRAVMSYELKSGDEWRVMGDDSM